MTDIVWLDIETLGLDPAAPIWEFAAVRRYATGAEDRTEFRIRHNPGHYLDELPERFRADYDARYIPRDATPELEAAIMINIITRDSIVIGCNPGFDIERLDKLLRRHGMTPSWHYRPICITTMGAGWLHGVAARAIDDALEWGEQPDPAFVNRRLDPPWSSDEISRGVGVNPNDYARHTAMGYCLWAIAQWDIVTGKKP